MSSNVLENIKALNKCRQSLKQGDYGNLSQEKFTERMQQRFKEFYDRYPLIFEKTVLGFFENKDEINRLKLAISTHADIDSGKVEKEEGEKSFGQNLVDAYVKPQLEQQKGTSNPTEPLPRPPTPEPESDSESDLESEDENVPRKQITGILNDIVMPAHELGAGDTKRKIKIDSDDESDEE